MSNFSAVMSPKKPTKAAADGVAKVSISFPPELLERIDRKAAADRRPRSQWIALQLERMFEESDPAGTGPKRPA